MQRPRHGTALLSLLVLTVLAAIVAIACACASQATAAETSPSKDGVTYLVKVTGAG